MSIQSITVFNKNTSVCCRRFNSQPTSYLFIGSRMRHKLVVCTVLPKPSPLTETILLSIIRIVFLRSIDITSYQIASRDKTCNISTFQNRYDFYKNVFKTSFRFLLIYYVLKNAPLIYYLRYSYFKDILYYLIQSIEHPW